jgi:hypothetical protein
MAANGSLDGPTMKLRSGRTIGKWHIAQAKLRHNINMVGDNIKFDFTDPPDLRLRPMSQVFNIPELLEEILQNLRPGFPLQNVQMVCRGFKESIDESPTFRKRAACAIHVSDDPSPDDQYAVKFSYGLVPKYLGEYPPGDANPHVFRFVFSEDTRTFENYKAMERFRTLRVFDRVPQVSGVYWRCCSPYKSVDQTVEDEDATTFGDTFDMVAELAGDSVVTTLDITWFTDSDILCRISS